MVTIESSQALPRSVVFEGFDGVGKTSLADALLRYCRRESTKCRSFPGTEPGFLGKWMYRLHYGMFQRSDIAAIAPPAPQLLHVAAHVDAIVSWIVPALANGCVILDRYWQSTYLTLRPNPHRSR